MQESVLLLVLQEYYLAQNVESVCCTFSAYNPRVKASAGVYIQCLHQLHQHIHDRVPVIFIAKFPVCVTFSHCRSCLM